MFTICIFSLLVRLFLSNCMSSYLVVAVGSSALNFYLIREHSRCLTISSSKINCVWALGSKDHQSSYFDGQLWHPSSKLHIMERKLTLFDSPRRTGHRWSWGQFPSRSSNRFLLVLPFSFLDPLVMVHWALTFIQILITFIANSFLALACGTLEVILSLSGANDICNGIDRWFATKSQRLMPFHITQDQRNFWQPIPQKFVITLSDQQFLTGIAILSAGLWEHCTISVYHFTLVLDVGWFSSAAHLIAVGCLAPYLRRDKMRRNFRVFLMVIMMALLITTFVMRSHQWWYWYWTTPAQCLIDDLAGNISVFVLSTYIFSILRAYIPMIITLYESACEACRKWLLIMPTAMLDKAIDIGRRASFRHVSYLLLLKVLLLVRWLFTGIMVLLTSWSLTYLLVWSWFGIGIYVIMIDRTIARSLIVGNENELTFGQFVPIFLIGSSLMVFRESYYGKTFFWTSEVDDVEFKH